MKNEQNSARTEENRISEIVRVNLNLCVQEKAVITKNFKIKSTILLTETYITYIEKT